MEAVHSGELVIADYQGDFLFLQKRQRFISASCFQNSESLPAEVFRKGLQPEGIVIDQQNAREVTHRCSGANTSIRL